MGETASSSLPLKVSEPLAKACLFAGKDPGLSIPKVSFPMFLDAAKVTGPAKLQPQLRQAAQLSQAGGSHLWKCYSWNRPSRSRAPAVREVPRLLRVATLLFLMLPGHQKNKTSRRQITLKPDLVQQAPICKTPCPSRGPLNHSRRRGCPMQGPGQVGFKTCTPESRLIAASIWVTGVAAQPSLSAGFLRCYTGSPV